MCIMYAIVRAIVGTYSNIDEVYYPYRKPNDTPLYININSDHPPIIKKKLRGMIENRLSQISSSKEVFDNEKAIYEKALKDSGHPHELNYQPPNNTHLYRGSELI